MADSPISICCLSSGSKGNATWVSDGENHLLIDAGLSGKVIAQRMETRELSPEGLTALLVTHEHIDHVKGIGVMARRYNLPVYINEATLNACTHIIGAVPDIRLFSCGHPFHIGRMRVHPFAISHDAADPVGFTIRNDTAKIGVVTDLGIAPHMIRERLKDAGVIMIESNHDPDLLMTGPYPWPLKQRVKSRLGHLSNPDAADFLASLMHRDVKHVILAHLSEENNRPDLAAECGQAGIGSHNAKLTVAAQEAAGPILTA